MSLSYPSMYMQLKAENINYTTVGWTRKSKTTIVETVEFLNSEKFLLTAECKSQYPIDTTKSMSGINP